MVSYQVKLELEVSATYQPLQPQLAFLADDGEMDAKNYGSVNCGRDSHNIQKTQILRNQFSGTIIFWIKHNTATMDSMLTSQGVSQ
jgi:hypothetical protein